MTFNKHKLKAMIWSSVVSERIFYKGNSVCLHVWDQIVCKKSTGDLYTPDWSCNILISCQVKSVSQQSWRKKNQADLEILGMLFKLSLDRYTLPVILSTLLLNGYSELVYNTSQESLARLHLTVYNFWWKFFCKCPQVRIKARTTTLGATFMFPFFPSLGKTSTENMQEMGPAVLMSNHVYMSKQRQYKFLHGYFKILSVG